jgi:hypothetical protein
LLALDFEFGVLASGFEDAFKKVADHREWLSIRSVRPRSFVVGLWQTYEDDKCKFFKTKRA